MYVLRARYATRSRPILFSVRRGTIGSACKSDYRVRLLCYTCKYWSQSVVIKRRRLVCQCAYGMRKYAPNANRPSHNVLNSRSSVAENRPRDGRGSPRVTNKNTLLIYHWGVKKWLWCGLPRKRDSGVGMRAVHLHVRFHELNCFNGFQWNAIRSNTNRKLLKNSSRVCYGLTKPSVNYNCEKPNKVT